MECEFVGRAIGRERDVVRDSDGKRIEVVGGGAEVEHVLIWKVLPISSARPGRFSPDPLLYRKIQLNHPPTSSASTPADQLARARALLRMWRGRAMRASALHARRGGPIEHRVCV